MLLHERQSFQASELGHDIVGNHHIPALRVQGFSHGFAGFYPAAQGIVTGALQFELQQRSIILRILDQQYLERAIHSLAWGWGSVK